MARPRSGSPTAAPRSWTSECRSRGRPSPTTRPYRQATTSSQLRPGVASSDRYHLSISRLDPFDLAVDQEPNDVAAMARPVPGSLVVEGTGTSEGDYDWYRLPALAAGDTLAVRYAGAISGVHLSDGAADIAATDDPESGTLTSEPLASDAPLFLRVVASGDYHLELSSPALAAAAPPGELPVTLSVTPDTAAVSAYESVAQRVPATIEVANGGADPWTWRSTPAPATTACRWPSTRRT